MVVLKFMIVVRSRCPGCHLPKPSLEGLRAMPEAAATPSIGRRRPWALARNPFWVSLRDHQAAFFVPFDEPTVESVDARPMSVPRQSFIGDLPSWSIPASTPHVLFQNECQDQDREGRPPRSGHWRNYGTTKAIPGPSPAISRCSLARPRSAVRYGHVQDSSPGRSGVAIRSFQDVGMLITCVKSVHNDLHCQGDHQNTSARSRRVPVSGVPDGPIKANLLYQRRSRIFRCKKRTS